MIFGRKHQTERDAAMTLVREAAASGRITALDRDRRIQDLAHAGSLEDIEVHLRDLRLPPDPHHGGGAPGPVAPRPAAPEEAGAAYDSPTPHEAGGRPPAPPFATTQSASSTPVWDAPAAAAGPAWQAPPPASGPSAPGVSPISAPPASTASGVRSGKGTGCLIGLIVMFLVGPLVGVVGVVGLFGEFARTGGSDTASVVTRSEQELLTPRGWDRMVATLVAETGSARVTMATVYEDYAVFLVPADSGVRLYYYDGELAEQSRASSADKPFDLAEVPSRLLPRLARRAEHSVPTVETRYVVVRSEQGQEPTLWVYASGGGRTGYVQSDLRGRILFDSAGH